MNQPIFELIERGKSSREKLFQSLRSMPEGITWCQMHTRLADGLIRGVYRIVKEEQSDLAPVTIVATGGYGRKELAPYSDIDLTIIPLDEMHPTNEITVRALHRGLIEVFGALNWPLGYAYRLVSDCPGLDAKTRAGLMDGRLVAGNRQALKEFMKAFWSSFPTAEFILNRFAEIENFHQMYHETPFVVEFHLREGAGGLREAQNANYLRKATALNTQSFPHHAVEQLILIRNILHITSHRKQDQLIRTKLDEVSSICQNTPDAIIETVMQAGDTIHNYWLKTVDAVKKASIKLAPGVTSENGKCKVSKKTNLADAVIGIGRASRLGIELEPVPPPKLMGDLPLTVPTITSGEAVIRALEKTRLMDALIPEFARCRFLRSKDSVHTYSVGEHSIRVIGELDRSRKKPEFAETWSEITNHRPLYIAALLHDIGKAEPNEKHSFVGAKIAAKICHRLGIIGDEADTIVWLIREHLTLLKVARTHDLALPGTIHEFAKLCGRRDRLAMLYLLTYADTVSVAEHVWTPQSAAAAAELTFKARRILEADEPTEIQTIRPPAQSLGHSQKTPQIAEFLDSMPPHYLFGTRPELFHRHLEMVTQAKKGEIVVDFETDSESHATDVTLCMLDLPKPGLLSRILGIAYALDLTLHSARVSSTKDHPSVALDVLSLSYGGKPLPNGLCKIFSQALTKHLKNRKSLEAFLRNHGKDPNQKQLMLMHRFYEGDPSVIEIETPEGRGMPYRIASMLAGFGWRVLVARIATFAGKGAARFYVDKPSGKPLTAEEVATALQSAH